MRVVVGWLANVLGRLSRITANVSNASSGRSTAASASQRRPVCHWQLESVLATGELLDHPRRRPPHRSTLRPSFVCYKFRSISAAAAAAA